MNIIEWRDHLLESNLSYKAKLVGLCLSQFYRHKKPTYPSIITLSQLTSLTVNPVQDGLKELQGSKYIERKKERMRGNKFTSNVYTFIGVTEKHLSPHDTSNDTSNDTSYDTSYDISPHDMEVEEVEEVDKKKKITKKIKTTKAVRLPFESLPEQWLSFCQEEMGWSESQSRSAYISFYDYNNSADCKTPKRKDWFMVFKNSCRSGYTKPNINLTKGKQNDKERQCANAIFEGMY